METFSEFSSETFGSLRKSSEVIGKVRMILRVLSDNFGANFVSFSMKITVTVNFFTISVKMPKI